MLKRISIYLSSHMAIAGTLAGWYEIFARIVSGLLIIPILVTCLGHSASGLWFSLQSALFVMLGMDFGFSRVMSRQIVHSLHGSALSSDEKTDFIETKQGLPGVLTVFAAGRSIFQWLCLVAILISAAIYGLMLGWGELFAGNELKGSIAWSLITADLLLTLLALPHKAMVEGLAKVYLIRVVSGTYFLLRAILITLAAVVFGDIIAVAAIAALTSIANYLLFEHIVTVETRGHQQPGVDRDVRSHLLRVAIPLGINTSGVHMMSNIQPLIVGSILGPAMVVGFFVCQKIALMIGQATYQVVIPHIPLFTAETLAGNNASAAARMKKVMLTLSGMLILGSTAFIIYGKLAMELMAGKQAVLAYPLIILIVMDVVLINLSTAFSEFVLARGQNPFARSSLAWIIGGLFLCVLLTQAYGLAGAACASMLVGLFSRHTHCIVLGLRLLARLEAAKTKTANPSQP